MSLSDDYSPVGGRSIEATTPKGGSGVSKVEVEDSASIINALNNVLVTLNHMNNDTNVSILKNKIINKLSALTERI